MKQNNRTKEQQKQRCHYNTGDCIPIMNYNVEHENGTVIRNSIYIPQGEYKILNINIKLVTCFPSIIGEKNADESNLAFIDTSNFEIYERIDCSAILVDSLGCVFLSPDRQRYIDLFEYLARLLSVNKRICDVVNNKTKMYVASCPIYEKQHDDDSKLTSLLENRKLFFKELIQRYERFSKKKVVVKPVKEEEKIVHGQWIFSAA